MSKIVITGGGTGGHVFPALSIAEELKKRQWEVLYVGTARGMEAKLVPEKGFKFFTLKTGAVKNQSPITILKTILLLVGATLWSLKFLIKERPTVVLGVGGYVSFPISLAAFLLRIPLYLQEQNSSVGIANRILGRISTKIFLGFEGAMNYFPRKKCIVTGNPLRSSFFESNVLPYDINRDLLFVMGGSQGAKAINDAMITLIPRIREKFPKLKILHQTGNADFPRVQEAYRKLGIKDLEARPFISDMVQEYQRTSLMISRSGALSVSELIYFGLPSIFVPYPRAGQNDQITNAYLVEKAGAARVVEQGEGFTERFWNALCDCLNPSVLQAMSKGYEKLPRANASVLICDLIEKNVL